MPLNQLTAIYRIPYPYTVFVYHIQVWGSIRDWKTEERKSLEEYLQQARRVMHAKRLSPGVPAVVSISNGGDRRRKRKIAWAVMAAGKRRDDGKLCVGCAGSEITEVSKDAIQPIQVRVECWMVR